MLSLCKKRVNCDKTDFATKLRMFGPLIIDEGPLLSTTAGRAVAQLMLVWSEYVHTFIHICAQRYIPSEYSTHRATVSVVIFIYINHQ